MIIFGQELRPKLFKTKTALLKGIKNDAQYKQ